jgi:SAM-dependent methyltransferase
VLARFRFPRIRAAQRIGTAIVARILSLSMVKNEQDIIEPFIRHNARLVDWMVILDNGSVDDTRRIIVECARELGNVIVTDSGEFAYNQSERMTRLLHGCQSAFFADFVLFLDADEFVSAADREDLQAALDVIPARSVGQMPWRTFVLKPSEKPDAQDPPRDMRWRRTSETPPFSKAVLRLDGAYRPDLILPQGSHDVFSAAREPLPSIELDDLPLLHFPVRSRRQLLAKSIVGWMAYLAKNASARQESYGRQWREIFDQAMRAPDAFGGDALCEASMRYAQLREPIDWDRDTTEADPPAHPRRYSTGAFAEPLQLVALSWERSLSVPPAIELQRFGAERGEASASPTAFDPDWHWDHLFVDVAPFRYIAEKYRPAEVLDVGCGIGAYLRLFKEFGTGSIFGVDGIPLTATALRADQYAQQDLLKPLELHRRFDLVVCVEVAEHLAKTDADRLLESISRHAQRLIVFSAATPDQPGLGHINCRPIEYWLERWAALGWIPILADSLGMRSLSTLSWFHHNLVVLARGEASQGAEAIGALRRIGERPFTWYGQPPGIRASAFSEPLPPATVGYAPSV